ncbi:S1 RNA-binding domain-containing protein [uncultured Flavonifractor sp.]|uniref:S1 RNA-binding domain-containing protein n=1 Tax=uncultured Flavonifractor sp. TaxID=1193534 RepID=UPI00260462C1|nr:S1 RNA-binding domain-containing protein [uncultured Flavonifractor sp.]
MTKRFPPEGRLLHTPENQAACASADGLKQAMETEAILEGTALLCTPEHDLIVSLGPYQGVIPREEAALGIAEGVTRDIAILSRVGKPVCFTVTGLSEKDGQPHPILSRRAAQQQALTAMLEHWKPGQIIQASVTHLDPFGAFVDIGCGVPSLIGVENISVSRIPHPSVRFRVGQEILAVVLDLDPVLGRIYLTHKELLGTWAENVAPFQPGMTVPGVVRGVKDYGVFVELTPNLSGLAERDPRLTEGARVSVYLKAILPERMKIKLLAIELLPPLEQPQPLHYYIQEGRLEHWKYAPPGCVKVGMETIFAG